MPILRTGGMLLLFIHVPKTGGTTIENYLAQKGRLGLRTPHRMDGMDVTPQHLHRQRLDDLFGPGFFDHSFAVLRDPVERLISEYRFRARPATPMRWSVLRGSRHPMVKTGQGRRRLDFDQWLRWVLARQADDPSQLDNHIRPQAEFVRSGDRLFRFEEGLDPVCDWIDAVTCTPRTQRGAARKVSSFPKPKASDAARRAIRQAYANDYALIDSLAPQGRAD